MASFSIPTMASIANPPPPPMNRQESHRIYLQQFAPHSASSPQNSKSKDPHNTHHGHGGHANYASHGHHPSHHSGTSSSSSRNSTHAAPVYHHYHRHDSHEVHPPNYPMTTPGVPYRFSSSSSDSSPNSSFASYSFSSSLSSMASIGGIANLGNTHLGPASPAALTAPAALAAPAGSGGGYDPSFLEKTIRTSNQIPGSSHPNHPSHHSQAYSHFSHGSKTSHAWMNPNRGSTNGNNGNHSNNNNHNHNNATNDNPPNKPNKPKTRFVGYPATITTSAAVRLTDRARTKDVTALLRGKFGLPSLPSNSSNGQQHPHGAHGTHGTHGQYGHHDPHGPSSKQQWSNRSGWSLRQNSQNSRRSKIMAGYHSSGTSTSAPALSPSGNASRTINSITSSNQTNATNPNNASNAANAASSENEVDVLVLVGTMEGPPKGYLRFEHEEFLEEQARVERVCRRWMMDKLGKLGKIRQQQQQQLQLQQQQQQQQQQQMEQQTPAHFTNESHSRVRTTSTTSSSSAATIGATGATNATTGHLPVSQSAATVQASGGISGIGGSGGMGGLGGSSGGESWPSWKSSMASMASMALSPSFGSGTDIGADITGVGAGYGRGGSSGSGVGNVGNMPGVGLDLSSSRGGLTASGANGASGASGGGLEVRNSSWGALMGMGMAADVPTESGMDGTSGNVASTSRAKLSTLLSEMSVSTHSTTAAPPPTQASTPPIPLMPHTATPMTTHTKATTNTRSNPRASSTTTLDYDRDSEPIHIVRTVLPDEHPLQVRDEMMTLLHSLRHRAEEEMGLRLPQLLRWPSDDRTDEGPKGPQRIPSRPSKPQKSQPSLLAGVLQPTFRWYFQPCSALGGCGPSSNSPKIQSIPSYIDLEGYCTGSDQEEEEVEEVEEVEDGEAPNGECKDSGDSGGPHNKESGISTNLKSAQLRQLSKERRRISILRELSDPSFLLSGYLLKQSWKDPNVWRRVYCVLSEDRMWIVGRMRPLTRGACSSVGSSSLSSNTGNTSNTSNTSNSDDAYFSNEDILFTLRVGRHSYINLHRSLLLEGGDGDVVPSNKNSPSSSLRSASHFLSPLGRRLPNAFRICTAEGNSHTFRAFHSSSFRIWVTSLSEKITLKHGDGLMELADLISVEETSARGRRMEDLVVNPILDQLGSAHKMEGDPSPLGLTMDITRFGMSVAEFKELCRHVDDAVRPFKYHGVVNVQTKVGPAHGALGANTRQPNGGHGNPNSNMTSMQRARNEEHIGMVSAVWEDARVVASKSAQLLHALAALQHDMFREHSQEEKLPESAESIQMMMSNLIVEQKEVQTMLGKRWNIISMDSKHQGPQTGSSSKNSKGNEDKSSEADVLALPPLQLFDTLLTKFQCISAAMP